MAVKPPTLYLLCGSASASKAAVVESIKDEFDVEVVLFEIITAGMSGQSLAINDSLGNQLVTDKYIANAKGAGMKVELPLQPQNS